MKELQTAEMRKREKLKREREKEREDKWNIITWDFCLKRENKR